MDVSTKCASIKLSVLIKDLAIGKKIHQIGVRMRQKLFLLVDTFVMGFLDWKGSEKDEVFGEIIGFNHLKNCSRRRICRVKLRFYETLQNVIVRQCKLLLGIQSQNPRLFLCRKTQTV